MRKHNPLIEKLKRCRDSGAVISVYTSTDTPERFSVGVVRNVTPSWTLMDCLGVDGAHDALCVIRTSSIYSIVYDDRYTLTVAAAWNGESTPLSGAALRREPLIAALEFARDNRLIADIEYADSGCWDVSGYVDALDRDVVSVLPLDENGEVDGVCFTDISVITWVDVRPGESNTAKPAPGVILFKNPVL